MSSFIHSAANHMVGNKIALPADPKPSLGPTLCVIDRADSLRHAWDPELLCDHERQVSHACGRASGLPRPFPVVHAVGPLAAGTGAQLPIPSTLLMGRDQKLPSLEEAVAVPPLAEAVTLVDVWTLGLMWAGLVID